MKDLRPNWSRSGLDLTYDDATWRGTMSQSHEPSAWAEQDASGRNSSRSDGKWWNDAEAKRMRRLARYKYYSAEGKLRGSFKRGIRWLKIKCVAIVATL